MKIKVPPKTGSLSYGFSTSSFSYSGRRKKAHGPEDFAKGWFSQKGFETNLKFLPQGKIGIHLTVDGRLVPVNEYTGENKKKTLYGDSRMQGALPQFGKVIGGFRVNQTGLVGTVTAEQLAATMQQQGVTDVVEFISSFEKKDMSEAVTNLKNALSLTL